MNSIDFVIWFHFVIVLYITHINFHQEQCFNKKCARCASTSNFVIFSWPPKATSCFFEHAKKARSQSSTGWFFRGKQADARLQRALDDLEVGRLWSWVCLCAADFSPCWNLLSWQHMQHTCSQVLNNYCSMAYIPTWMVNFYGVGRYAIDWVVRGGQLASMCFEDGLVKILREFTLTK